MADEQTPGGSEAPPPEGSKPAAKPAPPQPPGIPVLYLPGVERLQFRWLEDFPEPLRPVAELQFRGTWGTSGAT